MNHKYFHTFRLNRPNVHSGLRSGFCYIEFIKRNKKSYYFSYILERNLFANQIAINYLQKKLIKFAKQHLYIC